MNTDFTLLPLPPAVNLETSRVFKKLIEAHRFLAELKGFASTIPNEDILIGTFPIDETIQKILYLGFVIK